MSVKELISSNINYYGDEDCKLIRVDSETELYVHLDLDFCPWLKNSDRGTVWMLKNGTPVAMLTFMTKTSYDNRLSYLCDIEVRKEFRGNKYALQLMNLVNEHVTETVLHTTGHYTPEGHKNLHGSIPLAPECYTANGELDSSVGVHFKSMNFVHDWNRLELKR